MKQTPTWKPPAPLEAANLFPFLLLSLQTCPGTRDQPLQPAPEPPLPTLNSAAPHEKHPNIRGVRQEGAGKKGRAWKAPKAGEGMPGGMQLQDTGLFDGEVPGKIP